MTWDANMVGPFRCALSPWILRSDRKKRVLTGLVPLRESPRMRDDSEFALPLVRVKDWLFLLNQCPPNRNKAMIGMPERRK
jgi:hypothetical protein